jgi:hypothetical protein
MTKRSPRSESPGKVEGSAGHKDSTSPPSESPMDRFRALTKSLLNVSRKQLDKEQKRFDAANTARRNKNRGA